VKTLAKSSLLFFQTGQMEEKFEVGLSGLPMWRIVGEGQRQFGPKICRKSGLVGRGNDE
jgi:hypothetical protein